jgi:DNA-binding CsgD family transcriptional regulator
VITELSGGVGTIRSDEYADAFRSLFERSGICMASLNAELRVQEANEPFLAELGGTAGTLEGRELFDFLRVRAESDLRRQLMRLAAGWSERVVERVHVVRGGDQANPAQLTAVSTKADTRAVPRVVVMLQLDEAPEGPAGRSGGRLQLTDLDARILQGVAMGMSTVNLATKLYLSRQGVEYHVGTMLKKFKAGNRPALVSRAYSIGVLDASSWPPKVAPMFIK